MKNFDAIIKKNTEKIHLKVSEKRELRERIFSYMEYHPLAKPARKAPRDLRGAIPSDFFTVFSFNTQSLRIMAGAFALVLVAIPFVAERSVPGDVLYLVKTNVTEPVQGKLATSPYEKIEFQTHLMEKRVAEARVLAKEGRLTESVKTQIAATVKEHSDAVQNTIAELRTKDADGAAIAQIAYNSSLEVQSAVLGAQDGSSTAEASSVSSILSVVNEAREDVVSNQASTTPSFDGLIAQLESETTHAYELFETVKKSATPEEATDIERRLSDINRTIEEAKVKRAEDETAAAGTLVDTLGQVQKLILFMTDIHIQETVSLETIVPIGLSIEERATAAHKEAESIEASRLDIIKELAFVSATEDSRKINDGLDTLGTLLIVNASTTIDATNIDEIEVSLQNARALVTDLTTLVKSFAVHSPVSEEIGAEKKGATSTPEEMQKATSTHTQ